MTDRTTRRRITILALLAILMGASSGHSEPSHPNAEYHAILHAERPTLAPAEGERSILTAFTLDLPDIELPPDPVPVGEPFVIGMPLDWKSPEGVRVRFEWEFNGYKVLPYGPNRFAPFIVKAGEYTVTRKATWATADELGRVDETGKFTVGDPPPPKPLIELAGPDAPNMAFVYDKLSAGSFTSLVHFHNVEASALADMGLSANPAVPVIRDRLEKIAPFDGAKLVAELAAIAGELGKAPEPDKPDVPGPNTPGTPVSFDGFHVVFVHESGAKERLAVYNLTAAQVLDSYLDTHCANGAHGWRVWDQQADLTNAPPHFKELMALPRSTSPAMVVASGKRAAVLPVPTSPEEAVTILKQWGGE